MLTIMLLLALQNEGPSTLVTFRNADSYRLPANLASDGGDVALTYFKSTTEVFHKFDPKNFLQIGGTGEFFGYDWTGGSIGLPEDLQAFRLNAAYLHFFDEHWRAVAFASISFQFEEGADTSQGGTYAGGVGAAYRFGPELTLGALLGALTRIEDDPSVFLMPYVEWKPSGRWTIRTEMRDGLGLEGLHHLDDAGVWSLQARGVFSKRRFRLSEDAIRPNGVFEDARFTVMVGGRWQPLSHLSVSLVLGLDLRQQYALEDERGREREEFESHPGLVLGFYFTGSF
jgi:hypothetical protein